MALRLFFKIVFFSCTLFSRAQDISGVWVGNYEGYVFASNPDKLVVEIFVYNDSLIAGLSHLYYGRNQYEHYKINGVIRKNGIIYFSEDSTIAVKLGFLEENCLGNYTMKLSTTDTSLLLSGRWRDNSTAPFHCPSTGAWLEKKISKKQIKSPKKEQKPERTSDIQSLIELTGDEKGTITIELYDNGIVDQDSVTLYLDDSLLLYKQLVTSKPIVLNIALDRKISLNKLTLVAESLGSIPPCTVLMIVKTNKKRYEVNLSSNFNSNAVIEFFLKE